MDESLKLEKNIKIYPFYKMFSWDLLFYYAIIFLFLVKTKGLTASQIFFADAFYPIFKFLFQVSCARISDYFGLRKSILIGNIFVSSAILLVLLCSNIIGLIIVNLLFAIGYNLKELCEAPFLNSSIENKEKKREIFSKVDGIGGAKFYVVDAIAAASTGFLFTINNYLPIILSLLISIIGTILCLTFSETPNIKPSRNNIVIYNRDLQNTFKHIFQSKRLRSLIMFSSFFASLLAIFKTYMSSLLVDIEIPEIYFGFITARNSSCFCNFF